MYQSQQVSQTHLRSFQSYTHSACARTGTCSYVQHTPLHLERVDTLSAFSPDDSKLLQRGSLFLLVQHTTHHDLP